MTAAALHYDAFGSLKRTGMVLGAAAILGLGLLVAVNEGPRWFAHEKAPALALEGGGFLFNYRIAEVSYGLVAQAKPPVPDGTLIEAHFADPAGGPPLVVTNTAHGELSKIVVRSPAVHGVKAGVPYDVTVHLIDPRTKEAFATLETSFKSDLDDTVMPTRPLTVGPGYQRPPEP